MTADSATGDAAGKPLATGDAAVDGAENEEPEPY